MKQITASHTFTYLMKPVKLYRISHRRYTARNGSVGWQVVKYLHEVILQYLEVKLLDYNCETHLTRIASTTPPKIPRLKIEIESACIFIRSLTKIDESVLSHEIIITAIRSIWNKGLLCANEEIFIGFPECRQKSNTLPFLVQQSRPIGRSTISETEPV
jgi:hypothetical protein